MSGNKNPSRQDYSHGNLGMGAIRFPFSNNPSIYSEPPCNPGIDQAIGNSHGFDPTSYMSFTECLQASTGYGALSKAFDLSCSSSEVLAPRDGGGTANELVDSSTRHGGKTVHADICRRRQSVHVTTPHAARRQKQGAAAPRRCVRSTVATPPPVARPLPLVAAASAGLSSTVVATGQSQETKSGLCVAALFCNRDIEEEAGQFSGQIQVRSDPPASEAQSTAQVGSVQVRSDPVQTTQEKPSRLQTLTSSVNSPV